MRNYLYISDAKVDTYLPQFNKAEKKRIAGKLGFDIGVFEASVEGERLPLTNRVHRLEAVESKIRKDMPISPIEAGGSWFEGTVSATAAVFKKHKDVTFFFSNDRAQFLGLAGSAHHVIGNLRRETAYTSMSYLDTLVDTLEGVTTNYAFVVQDDDDVLSGFVYAGVAGKSSWTSIMMDISAQFETKPKQDISYLARRLTPDVVDPDGKRWTLGTPLFMALDDVTPRN
jgi:hypothetical protein